MSLPLLDLLRLDDAPEDFRDRALQRPFLNTSPNKGQRSLTWRIKLHRLMNSNFGVPILPAETGGKAVEHTNLSQHNEVAVTHGEGDLDLLSSSAMAISSSEPDSSTSFLSVTSPPPASDPDADRPGDLDPADRRAGEPDPAEPRPGEPDADLLDAGDAEREPDLDLGDLEVFLDIFRETLWTSGWLVHDCKACPRHIVLLSF